MPEDAEFVQALNVIESPRRQNTSCDPCRRSKRRCVVLPGSDRIPDKTCTNCGRLGHACTFEFAEAKALSGVNKRKRENHDTAGSSWQHGLTDFGKTSVEDISILNDQSDPTFIADQDVLSTWLNLEIHGYPEGNTAYTTGSLDQSTSPAEPLLAPTSTAGASVDNEVTLYSTGFPKIQNCSYYISPGIGASLKSPIYLLNSRINANILGERLTRIYQAITTASASRFLEYDCNLYPSKSRYRIGESMSDSPNESVLAKSSIEPQATLSSHASSHSMPDHDETGREISLLGSVRFLDHFSDLYGNRLNRTARKKSDEALNATLRVFSMQWLPSTPSTSDTSIFADQFSRGKNPEPRENENLLDSFTDAWVHARSLLQDAYDVRSFRVILATLTFVGIVTPTKILDSEGFVPSSLLDTALQKLCSLDRLVTDYCEKLGPASIYGSFAEASLSIIRWAGYIRDTGAALSMDHKSKLPDQWGPAKVTFNKEAIAQWATCSDLLELDSNIQRMFRQASAETFCIWRQIINIKESSVQTRASPTDQSRSVAEAINLALAKINEFNETYQVFTIHSVNHFSYFSTCPKISIVTHTMFWSLGILLLADVFQNVAEYLDASTEQYAGPIIRIYQHDAVSTVAQVVEGVLNLPTEEMFNLQNGLGAEAPITAYHVTPSLAVTALKKAIESVIDHQYTRESQCDLTEPLVPDGIWDHQIDILMKGLMSLDVTIGGSQTCDMALRELMRKHGDIISECWTSGFDS